MRSDMAKLLVERPRYKSRWKKVTKHERRNPAPHDESPSHEPMSRGRGTKELTDYLAPLRRFLEKQVGRPWDKVYSEVRQYVKFDSTAQNHILQHLTDDVELHVVFDEQKRPHRKGAYGTYPLGPGQMYVHPTTGLLCRTKLVRRLHRQNALRRHESRLEGMRWVNNDSTTLQQYKAIDGVWYWCRLVHRNTATCSKQMIGPSSPYDVALRRHSYGYEKFWGGDFVCVEKRQLNSREIKRLGLPRADQED